MKEDKVKILNLDSDPFGLKNHDWNVRIPEKSEMFDEEEAKTYIDGCDYPQTVDDLLLALEIKKMFGSELSRMRVMDSMCGPGKLGRELLGLGTRNVVFHDGDQTMITHARTQALQIFQPGQSVNAVRSLVEDIAIPDNTVDLVVVHNSTHQLSSLEGLHKTMEEFLRIIRPGGHIVIADYQRHTTAEFLESLEERLKFTRPEIVPLLLPSFWAAFSKEEFENVLQSIAGIEKWSVTDAAPPVLNDGLKELVSADPVKGHLMDYSPISLRVIVQKEK